MTLGKTAIGSSSKVGQSYDSEIEGVYEGSLGELTDREFKAKFSNSDHSTRFAMDKGIPKCMRFRRTSCACGGKILIESDGKAVCDLCKTIFNDGGNVEGLRKVTSIYSDGRKEEAVLDHSWEPRKGEHGHSHLNKFIKACRA